jgi:hypothetical protein
MRLWLDANDPTANGTYPSNGTYVFTWKDKSGYGNDAKGRTGLSTSVGVMWQSAGFNSKPCFSFGGVAENRYFWSQFINSSSITGNAMHVFVVASNNSIKVASDGALSEFAARFIGFSVSENSKDYDNTTSFGFLRQSGTGLGPYRANSYLANNPPSYNFATLHQAYFTGTQAKASFLNGDSTVVNSASNTMGNFNINYYKVGSATDYTDTPSYLTGRISEILVYSGTLTDTQIAQTEGYLAWKWGMQSLLPTAHPYKSSYP